MTECTYNSSEIDTYTRGGFSSRNEMCMMFLHYYPATRLAHCASRLTLKHVLLALGVSVWPITPLTRHLGLRVREPWQYQNLTFTDYLRVNGGKSRAANIRLQEASLHHSHMAECFDYGERRVYAVSAIAFGAIHQCFMIVDVCLMLLGWPRVLHTSNSQSSLRQCWWVLWWDPRNLCIWPTVEPAPSCPCSQAFGHLFDLFSDFSIPAVHSVLKAKTLRRPSRVSNVQEWGLETECVLGCLEDSLSSVNCLHTVIQRSL